METQNGRAMHSQPTVLKFDRPVSSKTRAERQRFRRLRVDLPGRLFVPSDSREAPCKVINLSPSNATIECDLVPAVSTTIILYADRFGRFEGSVIRRNSVSFGVRFVSTQSKRERTAEQLTMFAHKTFTDESSMRRHVRTPTTGSARFTRSDGTIAKCELLDLSISGVSVRTIVRPQIGEFILIGKLVGRIVRHHANGIGIQFVGLDSESPTTEHLHASLCVQH